MKNKNSDYTEDFKEWQEKQFQPGEYLGGKLPPHLKWPNRGLGFLYFLVGVITLIILGMIILRPDQSFFTRENTVGNITSLLFIFLYLAVGLKLITKNRKK